MESIYFEKQEGSLCAQHCLNALLQGPYFTAVDLAMHAKNLDDEERLRMAESGVDTEEYRTFLQQPSGNMDDSGYFSVQVISSCLSVWGLELIRYSSTENCAVEAQNNPEKMKAYICNYRDHWFTVRKLATQWFNLNSLSSGPKLITDTYLRMFLGQLKEEGYSIFIVFGEIPQCTADIVLKSNPISVEPESILGTSSTKPDEPNPDTQVRPFEGTGHRLGGRPASPLNAEENENLQRALQLSLLPEESVEDIELREAIELSLRNTSVSSEDSSSVAKPNSEDAEDTDLQRAISMSIDCTEVDEIRRRRLAYFEKFNTKT